MGYFDKKQVVPYILVFLGVVLLIIGFIFAFQGELTIFLIFDILSFAFIGFGIYLANKIKEEYERIIQRMKEAKAKRNIEKSLEIKKNNNFDEEKLSLDFKQKYGISILELQKEIVLNASDNRLILFDMVGEIKTFKLQLIKLNNIDYFFLFDNGPVSQLLTTTTMTDELLEIFKNTTIDQVEKILYPYEDLEYVEYINDVSQYSIGKKPSSFDLSIHESLYGTASAINKVNNSVHTITNDNSYIKLYFSSKSKITPKKYLLCDSEKRGESYYSGGLAKIWNEKEKNHVINSNLINSSRNNSQEKISISDNYAKLKELKELLDNGILTQEEFDAEKKKILNK